MRHLGEAEPPIRSGRAHWETIRDLLVHLWPSDEPSLRWRVVVAVALLIAAKVTETLLPLLSKFVVDDLTGLQAGESAPGVDLIMLLPIGLFGLLLAQGVARSVQFTLGELRDVVFARVGQRAIRRVALRTFRHLHALSLRFHLDRQTGGLSRVIERGTHGIEFLLRFMLFNVLPTLLALVLAGGALWIVCGWEYAAVTLTTVVVYIAYTLIITEWRIKFRREMNESDQSANTNAIDSLLNYETVKYFGNEEHEARRYDVGLRVYEEAGVKSKVSLSVLNIGQNVIISIGFTILTVMAAVGVADGTRTVGDFVMVTQYLLQLAIPLNFLGFVYREIKQALVDMEAMFSLMQVDQEVSDRPGAPPLALRAAPNGRMGTIAFRGVGFGYDPRRPILKDVSFMVPAGGTVAIVGPSGAGKSTISRLLYRFYDVDAGAIEIDGQDVRGVTQASLRANIGIVPQDTVLFNDTVFYNIAYGRPDATREEVETAARMAAVHDFVMTLPDGYDTRVGERGLKLSGGEKQRVAIARTILKDPAILMLDEATSALDTHTEKEIQESLDAVSADRTTLIIAHRLSTVVHADEILVLTDGRVVERGSHEELLALDEVYAGMWARQQAQRARLEAQETLELVERG